MKTEDIKLGQRIKKIRLGHNIYGKKYRQKDFANEIEATVQALSNWENGRNKPNDVRLLEISNIGGISVNELLYGDPKSYLDDLLFNSNLIDFSTIVFDKFYEGLESSASSEEDLYLSEEEAAKRYKRFSEQMKLDDHVDDLGSYIHLAYENRSDSNLVQMHLNDAHNEYSLLFGKSPEDANNDIKRKKKE